MKKLVLTYLLTFMRIFLDAQSTQLDSLKMVANTTQSDTVKCNALLMMAEGESDDAVWPKYNEEAFNIANNKLKHETNQALVKFYKIKLGQCYINKGYYEQYQKENSLKALENYNKAVDLLGSVGNVRGMASAYNNIGSVYENIGDIKRSIEYYNQALVYMERTGDDEAALPLNNIGMIFYRQKDYNSAIRYYLKSLNISKRTGNQHGIAYASNNLGLTYQRMNDFKTAETYFNTAIYNWRERNDKRMLSYAYNNLGCLYLGNGELEKAKTELDKSYSISVELNDGNVQAFTDLNYARIAFRKNQFLKAEEEALKALRLSKELAYPENIREACLVLSDIYEKLQRPEKSLEMYELHIRMRDSLNNEETKRASIKSDLKYEFDKKALADSVKVVEEKRLVSEQLRNERTQRDVLYGGLGLIALFALFMVNRFLIINKQKKIIAKQKQVVEEQTYVIEEKQKEIMDSIHYAKRIQTSHMPSDLYLMKSFSRLKKN